MHPIARVVMAAVVILVVLAAANNILGTSWDDIAETCVTETGLDASTCVCIVRELEDKGYEPEDVEGENYSAGALTVASSCL